MLTERFDSAFHYAHDLHRTQARKVAAVPYISHLMAVASLVIEHGGDEDQSIAALLHDAVEDQGGIKTLTAIRAMFGDGVADMVADCTDSWDEPRLPWRLRKESYIAALPNKPARSLLVVLADKTHNAEAIVADYRILGEPVWDRFNGGPQGTRWYYRTLAEAFPETLPRQLLDRLSRAVDGFAVD
ncbi:MAG: HD domain-containing protein [Rhodospirillaceae bacterium]|jgi:(p)ppGpp synthase/HD superfamily hydrolase|nr:HD domain-containing protein [Rhodospirillaceae bacterium]MBT3491146.1 HD domain-containing protein [Rhodospirillaceae bacterium]MBT3781231.1 HD domain-containing protein [Rhodospirillaceae bacterium]MBT3979449.1 HD domain-containing protein [Rhodospirillaceae bacterium]MBT4167944.1 HD domain-containing protein [Rhodospirillaceae bacterium]